ncbi:unnamed protein product [Porites lobata]|uniref:Uncharacterized protein n=1 Tax=Porites lobata TaxID=104759 RepID=A0ABN8PBF3_9CNID|nr:unnamed protein product [Porites lobata]
MKFLGLYIFVALIWTDGVKSSASVSLSSGRLRMTGTASVSMQSNVEDVWTALSRVYRYPIIKSGDLIVLRSAHSSYYSYLMYCTTSVCAWTSCSGSRSMTPSLWSSCSKYAKFYITARAKKNGEPINSGDTVSLRSYAYGSSYLLRCASSTSWYCRMQSLTSSMTGNNWLKYNYATFQLYSRYAVDGTPVQYGDVVGLKYPYYTSSTWLMRYGSYYRPRSCSSSSKTSCARENTYTGFRIFKKL